MLPVKTPKVPTTAPPPPVATSAVATEGPALFVTAPTNKRASVGDTTDEKFVGEAEAPPAKTAVISKLLPNMKR